MLIGYYGLQNNPVDFNSNLFECKFFLRELAVNKLRCCDDESFKDQNVFVTIHISDVIESETLKLFSKL